MTGTSTWPPAETPQNLLAELKLADLRTCYCTIQISFTYKQIRAVSGCLQLVPASGLLEHKSEDGAPSTKPAVQIQDFPDSRDRLKLFSQITSLIRCLKSPC